MSEPTGEDREAAHAWYKRDPAGADLTESAAVFAEGRADGRIAERKKMEVELRPYLTTDGGRDIRKQIEAERARADALEAALRVIMGPAITGRGYTGRSITIVVNPEDHKRACDLLLTQADTQRGGK